MTSRALVLSPSGGLGGGIERFVETIEWAFAACGIGHARVDLHHKDDAPSGFNVLDGRSRVLAHARMLARCRSQLQTSQAPTRLVVAHRALLPVASMLVRERSVRGISVICHGTDAWGSRPLLRESIERRLMRGRGVRVVAVSSFTAGALASSCRATLLPPGLSRDWFDMLVSESRRTRARQPDHHHGHQLRLVTAFRLTEWRGKGLAELLGAISALGMPGVRLTVCGSGEPPPELRALVRAHRFCSLQPNITDRQLAGELARADLFVLATRTTGGRDPSGEGFGLVLLEAQVAGTPVVAPAFGGSHDAFVDGVTGVAPADETGPALAKVLDGLLGDRRQLAEMGARAADWARERFDPERYASLLAARLL
jgi:phosphatidylinositol alpha-1,6-mannosyltransferase